MGNKYGAYYVTEREFKELLLTRKPLHFNYEPYLRIEPTEVYESTRFRCWMMDNNYDSTNGTRTGWEYVTKHNIGNGKFYYQQYLKGEKAYITTDGVNIYKVTDMRFDENGRAELLFHLTTLPNFQLPNTAFMLMPFKSEKSNQFYEKHIKGFLSEKLKMNVKRADDFTDTDVIIETIYREIEKSEFIICEITECNKNVFFEIGYAKRLNKNMILIIQKGVKADFFDLEHIRRIEFDAKNPYSFEARLLDTIKTIRGDS